MTHRQIAQLIEARTESERFIIGHIARNPAVKKEAAEGHDKRLQAQLRNQEAMAQTDQDGYQEYDQQRCGNAVMLDRQEPRQERSNQSYGRANGKIDAPADDHERYSNADDPEQGGPTNGVLNIIGIEKLRVEQRRDDADHDQQHENAQDLLHQFVLLVRRSPVARRMIDSSPSSLLPNSPVIRPSCITRARSDMPMTSAISLET